MMATLPAGPTKILLIDKGALDAGSSEPIEVRCEGVNHHTSCAEIRGPSVFVFSPYYQLPPRGSYAWVQTTSEVEV